MKIACTCGATIRDQTDNLPDKAHLIPDQEWFAVFDAIDVVIDDAMAGRSDADTAYNAIRRILVNAVRPVYQCRVCGRLFVDDRQHQLHAFAMKPGDTCTEILRSRDDDDHAS
jgi:hypothetical protein